ncbi:PucR family transcriptional regulator [Kitasatospora sp. NPDC052896]|uniref:PucR family transcriptional regulator n=1 Tax=Kitasatospora sp. NPDC052896 TaxID=3364061 RepID=UPI0037CC086B
MALSAPEFDGQDFDGQDEHGILALALSALASPGCFLPAVGYLLRDDVLVRHDAAAARRPEDAAMDAAVRALRGDDGALDLPGAGWSRAYSLRGPQGPGGYLVVRSPATPTREQLVLAEALVRQTASALACAASLRRERDRVAELRRRYEAEAAANAELRATVAELSRRGAVPAALTRVVLSGEGEQGITRLVSELTGFPAVSEDRFGHPRTRAEPGHPGPGRPPPTDRPTASVRDHDRLLAFARPHGEVLGVLALVDPEHRASEFAAYVLEQAATALALELSHARGLAEVELRIRRDLVEDLVTGTDPESALARADAAGHDLHGPHRVAVVRWKGPWSHDTIGAAVGRAAERQGFGFLLGWRAGAVVLVTAGECVTGALYEAVARELGSSTGTIGVGGRCDSPADLPHSYEEALRALGVRQKSPTPDGLTAFDELGVYRVLRTGDGDTQTERFVQEWLGPLLAYDRERHTDLVPTLSAYLESGGCYTASADALMIHRSTLRYRLQRIREITVLDLADPDVRLNLHLATRIWKVVTGPD